MRMLHSNSLGAALVGLSLAACAEGAAPPAGSEASPCPSSGEYSYERVAIQDVTNEAACRLVFRSTGVRLTGVADGSRPDPGRVVVKDGRGRYYSTAADGWESRISVWSGDGAYLTSFGRAGEGPGEFMTGESLALFVGAGDSLHVLDSSDWIVFSPEHEFVRQFPARQVGSADALWENETFLLYYDGRIVASSPHPSTSAAYFRIVNPDGSLDGTFGTLEEGTGTAGHYGHDRSMAYFTGNKYFWAAPSLEGAGEYVLEEWDVVGAEGIPEEARRPEMIRSLRRHQPWFAWTGDRNSSPVVRSLHAAVDGSRFLLVVQVWRPTQEYAEAMARYERIMREGGGGEWTPELDQEMSALAAELTHAVIEVIDVGSARLLASDAYPVGEVMQGNPLLPQRFFRDELTGYVYRVGEDGLPEVEIVEGVLVAKD